MMKGVIGQQNTDSDCGAIDRASHAPQSLSDNYYIHTYVDGYEPICAVYVIVLREKYARGKVLLSSTRIKPTNRRWENGKRERT